MVCKNEIMRGSEKVVKKKTIYLFFAAVVLFAILEPTAFIGTWVHSFCGYIRDRKSVV